MTGLLFIQLCLGGLYVSRIPIGNAPDERSHFDYAEQVAQTGRLPVANGERSYEAVQPPLYYLLAAPLDRLFSGRPVPERVSALRRQNVLFGLLDVWFIFLILCRVGDERTALLGAAFCALLPQFLFIGASVTNDRLADLLCTLILYMGVLGLEDERPGWWPWAAGALLAAGFLTKLTVAGVAAAFALIGLWKRPRAFAVPVSVGAIGAALTFGRNLMLYGDLSGARAMTYESRTLWSEFAPWLVMLFKSFWGLFAWMASPLPSPAYAALALITAAGMAGFILWSRARLQELRRPASLLLFAALALVFGQTFYFGFLLTRQPQGKFLFPALAPIAFILATGWSELWRKLPRAWRFPAALLAGAGVIALHVLSLRAV